MLSAQANLSRGAATAAAAASGPTVPTNASLAELQHASMFAQTVAALCLIWYIFIVIVCSIGYLQLFRYYSKPPTPAACLSEGFPEDEIPHITIIRPVCGLEPRLYDCLAATFRQTYPRSKLTIYICIASRTDPALPLLERLLADFPAHDAKIFVEDEDKKLLNSAGDNDNGRGEGARLGPNPKIRNMSRAYREARGDVVWICDCNVWVGKGVAGRMVDVLCGFGERGGGRPYKFVHQLPLVVDTVPEGEDSPPAINSKSNSHSSSASFSDVHSDSLSTSQTPLLRPSPQQKRSIFSHILQTAGGRLEETFMASSHAKFYTAINTVAIAPCIVGKSNMFRRSHLDSLTSSNAARSPGIDFFSDNICEDHLIGDMLWKVKLPCEREGGGEGQGKKRFGTHALLFGDPALQPMSSFSIPAYIARRVRWLRVRKFTVTLATLVEPGTESFLCSAYLAFAVTTLPGFESWVGVPRTWTAFWIVWVTSVVGWACVDCMLYAMLWRDASVKWGGGVPGWVLGGRGEKWKGGRRRWWEWLGAWLGREVLAWPVWAWAVLGGVSVEWRGKRFWVGTDMMVHEILDGSGGGREVRKVRRD